MKTAWSYFAYRAELVVYLETNSTESIQSNVYCIEQFCIQYRKLGCHICFPCITCRPSNGIVDTRSVSVGY